MHGALQRIWLYNVFSAVLFVCLFDFNQDYAKSTDPVPMKLGGRV